MELEVKKLAGFFFAITLHFFKFQVYAFFNKYLHFYRQYLERVNVTHHPNQTLSFKENRTYVFAPELSNGNTLQDVITSLNVPVVMGQEKIRGQYWDSFMLDSTLQMIEATLFVNKTVGELLFDGYEDTLLAIAAMAGTKSRAPMDKFGWFYKVRVYNLHVLF